MSQHLSPPTRPERDEIARFADMAEQWWDESGPLAPLHKLNPTRLAYIRDRVTAQRGAPPDGAPPLRGLRALDVGCGAGILCEPLARLGARVTGIDPASASIAAAQRHAEHSGVAIDYRVANVDELAAAGERFDLVCVLEVVEHVPKQSRFLATCGQLVDAGGALVLSTLNRTLKAYALGIVAAEYVLRWLPVGTHDWSRFIRPSEAARPLRAAGLQIIDITGMVYDPLRDRFRLSPDIDVNYLLFATRR